MVDQTQPCSDSSCILLWVVALSGCLVHTRLAATSSCVLAAACVQADCRLATRPCVDPHCFGVNMIHIEMLCIYACNGNAHGVTLQKSRQAKVSTVTLSIPKIAYISYPITLTMTQAHQTHRVSYSQP